MENSPSPAASPGPRPLYGFMRAHGAFVLLLAAWVVLHLPAFGPEYIWHDEICSILAASGNQGEAIRLAHAQGLQYTTAGELKRFTFALPADSLSRFFDDLAHYDIHPPLFFLLLRWWRLTGMSTVAGMIWLPMIIGVLSLIFLYRIAWEKLPKPYAVSVPGLWMFSIPGFDLATEIRQYGLLLFLVILLYHIVLAIDEDHERLRRPRWIIALAVVIAAGGLTQYLFILPAMAASLWLAWRIGLREKPVLIRLLAANALAGVLAAPWMPSAFIQFSSQAERPILDLTTAELAGETGKVIVNMFITPAHTWNLVVALLMLIVTFGIVRPPFPGFRGLFASVLLICAVLPAGLYAVGVVKISHLFTVRYFLGLQPVIYLALAGGMAALPMPRLRPVVLIAVVLFVGANHLDFKKNDRVFRESANLSTRSYLSAVAAAVETKLPGHYAVAVKAQPQFHLEAALEFPDNTPFVLGSCKDFSENPLLASMPKIPRGVLFLYKVPLAWMKNQYDCSEDFSRSLQPMFIPAFPPLDIINWKLTFLVNRSLLANPAAPSAKKEEK